MEIYVLARKGFAVGIILLFVGTCIIPSTAIDMEKSSQPSSRGVWLYVGGSGPGNYTRIQDAINDSMNGDTVFVYDDSSPYYENIIMDKSIFLIGENRNTTIIDGVTGGDVVSVQTDGVTISEFSIQYHCTYPSSDIAIKANHTSISQTIMISNNWYGISLLSCCDTNIVDNHISNKYAGISLNVFSNNNTISGNDLSNNNYGLEIESSSFNHIFYNNFMNNTINAFDNGSNTWNSEYPSAGNYWDNYTGIDVLWGQNQDTNGSDGVGDTPVSLPGGGNIDRYPLMEPYAMTRLGFGLFVGGLGLRGTIRNIGDTTAFRVCWRGTFAGGFILIGKDTLRVIPKPLLPGEERTVKVMVLGFGKATLTMMLWADNAPLCSGNCTATVLLFFIIGIHTVVKYQKGYG
jgi:parallel beta-helix repeat protein